MFNKIDVGDTQIAPVPDKLEYIDHYGCQLELEEICKSFEIRDILNACKGPNHIDLPIGMHMFDLFFLKYYLEKYNPKKVIEIGCGVSTRFMKNLGYNIEAFALEDVKGQDSTLFTLADLETEKGMKILKEKTEGMDFIFIDGDHSFRFAKMILGFVDGFKNRPPIVVHDFLHLDSQALYGEQYYILDEFLREDRFNYVLKSYTALLDKRFDVLCDKFSNVQRCMALMINKCG